MRRGTGRSSGARVVGLPQWLTPTGTTRYVRRWSVQQDLVPLLQLRQWSDRDSGHHGGPDGTPRVGFGHTSRLPHRLVSQASAWCEHEHGRFVWRYRDGGSPGARPPARCEDDANGSPAKLHRVVVGQAVEDDCLLVKGAGFQLTARSQLSAHSLRPACTCSGPQSPSAENDCTVAAITVPKIPRTNTTMPATAAARPDLISR